MKKKKVYCLECDGTGWKQNAYGRPKCENCNGLGYTWREVRKYTKKEKVIIPEVKSSLPLSPFQINLGEFILFANSLDMNIMLNKAIQLFREFKEKNSNCS